MAILDMYIYYLLQLSQNDDEECCFLKLFDFSMKSIFKTWFVGKI